MPKFEVYKSEEDSQHYWRLLAANGQIIATGAEAFSSKAAAFRGIGAVQGAVTEILAAAAGAQAEEAAQHAESEPAETPA